MPGTTGRTRRELAREKRLPPSGRLARTHVKAQHCHCVEYCTKSSSVPQSLLRVVKNPVACVRSGVLVDTLVSTIRAPLVRRLDDASR